MSINTKDYEKQGPYEKSDVPNARADTIVLKPHMCFEHLIQRGPDYYGNSYGSLSSEAVDEFKRSAYKAAPIKSLNKGESLPLHFPSTQGQLIFQSSIHSSLIAQS